MPRSSLPAAAGLSRRDFGLALAAVGASAAAGSLLHAADAPAKAAKKIKLGIDNFAVRAMNWKAPELIDYAAKLEVDSLFITDLNAFSSLETPHLKELKAKADDKGLQLYLGSMSVCPTSTTFDKKWGSAEEHLALGIRAANDLGSPALRVVLGNHNDRDTDGGIQARIADMVKVLKACRSRAIDAGVKIAVENHAGDMQSRELVGLIEDAGKDFVGANMDSGNATWTFEDPLVNLENLGPYVVTTSLRDSAIWQSDKGATIQWTAMGDGNVDLKAYFKRFAELCPDAPVNIETISGFNRELPYLEADFWKSWPNASAAEFSRFLAIAKRGKPRDTWSPKPGQDRQQAEKDFQRADLEKSIKFCKQELGLGVR